MPYDPMITGLYCPVLVEEFAAERVAIARAELKNVSDFDAA